VDNRTFRERFVDDRSLGEQHGIASVDEVNADVRPVGMPACQRAPAELGAVEGDQYGLVVASALRITAPEEGNLGPLLVPAVDGDFAAPVRGPGACRGRRRVRGSCGWSG